MTPATRAFLVAAFAISLMTGAVHAEVKEGDPGATCTNSTETIQGQQANCKSCSATKCDTSGSTVTNCRKETTKTCTIGGKVVNPTGIKTTVVPLQQSEVLEMSPGGDTGKSPAANVKTNKVLKKP